MFPNKSLNRCVTAALTAALTFVWSGVPYAQTVDALQDQQAAVFADQVKASLLALEDGDRDAPRDHWDPQYVVDEIGIEPADLFGWVQTNVAFVPYLGALRGAEGVLMDRVGNSLDQSLLLSALLNDAGYPTRLAHARLPSRTVDGLWANLAAARSAQASALVKADQIDAPAVIPENASLLDAADLYGLDRGGVGEVIDKTNADAAQVFVDLAPNVRNATVALAYILGPAGVGQPGTVIVTAAMAALSDHWWVEYQDNGAWMGLDLMAPDAASGALAAAADTFDPAALPQASEQLVTVRVIAEQLKAGTLIQKVVLEQAKKPRDLLGSTIGFRHFPMAWPQDWPQMTPDDVQIKLRAALYAQTEWLPVLTLGDTVLGSAGILDTGEIDPTPHPVNPFMQMTTAMIGMVSKATDVLATGGDNEQLLESDPELDIPQPPREEGELVSERLEFIISRPGSDPIVTSRDVFDLVGPDARAKGDLSSFTMSGQKALDRSIAMLEESEIQVLASKLDPEFLIHLGAQSALQNRPVLDDLSKDPFGKLPSNYMELFSKLTGLPYALYGLASLRFSLNTYSDWVYVDRPVVVLQHTRLRRAGGGDFMAGISLDIVENGVGVDPFAADNGFGLRLSQGVADTFAEAAALQQIGTVQPNVATVFARSDQVGARWIALRPGDQTLLGGVGWNADAKARMAHDLAIGNMLVVPAAPTAEQQLAGWWRIDPATGQALGVSGTGHGQAMVEYALIIIIETMMAAAQCALEASLTKALEKTLAEKTAGADSGKATGAGVKAGFEQAKKDVGNSSLRNRCMALGMFAGFKSLLMGFAMHAIKTAGNKGYDGSKPADSWERNAINNARNGSSNPGRPPTPTLPGIAPQGNAPRGTPTLPGVAPEANGPRGTPTLRGVAPEANGPRGNPIPPPKPPTPDEVAPTQRAPNPQPRSPFDQFKDAQQRAIDAQNKLAQHNPIDTPEGRTDTNKLWNDLDSANRDRMHAWDSMPKDQRPLQIPPVPQPGGAAPASNGAPAPQNDFSGFPPGGGPPSQVPSTQLGQAPIPEPNVDSLLNGLKGSPGPGNGVLPPPNSNPSADSLLNGLGGGKSPSGAGNDGSSFATAPTQPGTPPSPPLAPTQTAPPSGSNAPAGDFAGYGTGQGPVAPPPPLPQRLPPPPLPPPVASTFASAPTVPLTDAQAARASGLAGLMDALGPVATQ